MSDLTAFRDHCRRMATPGAHRHDCPGRGCPGCVPDQDRDLFTRLANEVDRHLASGSERQ